VTQENLQQEKRSAQEVDYVLMHRLLSPIQSATLILQARSPGCLLSRLWCIASGATLVI